MMGGALGGSPRKGLVAGHKYAVKKGPLKLAAHARLVNGQYVELDEQWKPPALLLGAGV